MHHHHCPECGYLWDCDDLCDMDPDDPENEIEKICPSCKFEPLDETDPD